jgi:hypothetical protein
VEHGRLFFVVVILSDELRIVLSSLSLGLLAFQQSRSLVLSDVAWLES